MKELNILVCGVGGQGNVLLESIIGMSAIKEGYSVKGYDTFGTALIDFMIGTDNANRMVAANRHPARGRATKIIALPRDMIRF